MMRDSADAPACDGSAAWAAAVFGGLEKGASQEKGGDTRVAGRRVEPAPRLQAQRSCLAYNGGNRPRMQSLFHDAQNLIVLPAIDPDDPGRIEPEADETGRIAIGAA